MDLPIELKYFRIVAGIATPMKSNDMPIGAYQIINKQTGIVEAEAQKLSDAYSRAITMDCNLEYTYLYDAAHKRSAYNHLQNIELQDKHVDDAKWGGEKAPHKRLMN